MLVAVSLSLIFVTLGGVSAEPLIGDTEINVEASQLDFERIAAEQEVPSAILLSLAWEASRFNNEVVSDWGSVGMFGFRLEGQGGLELVEAARLVGLTTAELLANPIKQVEAVAIWLAGHAENASITMDTPLSEWGPALIPFSASPSPVVQDRFSQFILESLYFGFESGSYVVEQSIDSWPSGDISAPPMPTGDYVGNAAYAQASSTNYTASSRGGSDIDVIVVHTVQGSYSGAISWFQNSSADVSAHYVVRSVDGEVTQCLLEKDIGWHAGNWSYNERSVGIEHEGYVEDPGQWYTEAMYRSSAILVADIISRTNVSLDRDHIVGHVEIPGATHTDPGTGWDWDRYMRYIDEYVNGTPGEEAVIRGVVSDSDIYNGPIIQGATVTINGGSTSSVTDSHGEFRFDDLGVGEWTVSASASGYQDGECTVEILAGSGEWWCSIALYPDGIDTSVVDTESQGPNVPDSELDASPDGWGHLPLSDFQGGCGCGVTHGMSVVWWCLLAPLAVVARRRR